jgi:hypothetical protein|tara:strand:- start:4343 stop:4495 length:153 start_codon:yes stop_codon:yes gene_type:complete
MNKNWSLELGSFPGFLFGVRSYQNEGFDTHVIYIGFVDIALIVYNDPNEK